jgi:hypothetical protein
VSSDDEADQDPRVTRVGRRGSSPDDGAATPSRAASATRLGRRAVSSPAAETDDTRLGRREAGTGHETQVGRRAEPAVDGGGTRLGRRRPDAVETGPGDQGVVRFGPGVPRTSPASPEWSARPDTKARRRRRPWIGGLITVAIVAGVIAWLLTRGADPIQAHAAQVTASSPAGACDTTVDVVGTIATNGRPGTITYQWNRNDGQPTDVLTQSVASGATDTQVHLHWSFSGHGRFAAVATLRVLDPGPASETAGTFTYACP